MIMDQNINLCDCCVSLNSQSLCNFQILYFSIKDLKSPYDDDNENVDEEVFCDNGIRIYEIMPLP